MGYDLDFWKYKPHVSMDHQHVCERLSNGEYVEGLEELPITESIERVEAVFSGDWKRLDDVTWESSSGFFQLYTTPLFFRVDCYGMIGEDMNKFIDIAAEFDCPLYDPQVGQRFDGG
jgi:hypothetical protein